MKQLLGGGAAALVSTLALAAAPVHHEPYQGLQPELVPMAQAGPADGRPRLRHVYLATPDTLALVIDAQTIETRPLEPYRPQPGDRVEGRSPVPYGPDGAVYHRQRVLLRDGREIGVLVGPDEHVFLWPDRRLVGEPLDLAWAGARENFALSSADDRAYAQAQRPLRADRKSRPLQAEWAKAGGERSEFVRSARHEIFLELPRPLKSGASYRLRLAGASPLGEVLTFTFDDAKSRTEAIQVNQQGYHPRQAEKTATLSMWLGSAGGADFSAVRAFRLVDERGRTAYTGPVRPTSAAVAGKQTVLYPAKDARPAALPMGVWTLDFSSFGRPGRYRACVARLGCSFAFDIADTVWDSAARMTAHGYLNQRSGIELGPPYTRFRLPRTLHPDDGFVAHRTDPALFFDRQRFTGTGSDANPFKRIQASILPGTSVPGAWGGWHDAADYDRSILPQNHLRAVHAMLDLHESNPAFFQRWKLDIPESGNALPDVIDEALWCMALFRRLQQPDGGVPSNVEAVEHPDEPAFAHSQPVSVTPPTPQASQIYAAAAAQLALALQPYDAALAADYRDSALRAMQWSLEPHPESPDIYDGPQMTRQEHLNLAAAWLYRLTGDDRWHRLFRQSLAALNPDGRVRLDRHPGYTGPWGLAVYALMPAAMADAPLQAEARRAVLAVADRQAAAIGGWPFHIDPAPNGWDSRLGDPWALVVAHRLTSNPQYLLALERMAQFGLGLNPDNAAYTSGLGSRQVVPFHMHAYFTGQPIPDGLTLFGPLQPSAWGGQNAAKQLGDVLYPAWTSWPWLESGFNQRYYAFTEYTVGGPMANHLLLRGHLAQHYASRR